MCIIQTLLNSKLTNDDLCQCLTQTMITKKFRYEFIELILIDFSLTVKAATLIFISGRGPAISSAKEGKSGFIYNLVKS